MRKRPLVSNPEQKPLAAVKSRVRERISRAACQLFYQRGIRAVCVDAILCEAGSNKMSFYRNFGSKDELVVRYLQEAELAVWQGWDLTVAEQAGCARAQVGALFDMLVANFSKGCPRGCAITNAAVEITEPNHPGRTIIERYKCELRRRFRQLAHDVHAREPAFLGDALMLLWEGCNLASVGSNDAVQSATKAANALILGFTTLNVSSS